MPTRCPDGSEGGHPPGCGSGGRALGGAKRFAALPSALDFLA